MGVTLPLTAEGQKKRKENNGRNKEREGREGGLRRQMGRRVRRRGRKLWKQNENVSCKRQRECESEERASEGTRREISRLPEVSGSAPVSPV